MRLSLNIVATVAAATALVSAVSSPVRAECKRFGFTVNDYGKDGPTKDAKGLLDKLIASKMAERGVKDYNTGKKSVSCELFLNLILFDEHTCTAEATVCWGGSKLPSAEQTAAETSGSSEKAADATDESKTEKKKKKDLAKKSDHAVSKTRSVENAIADPKPAPSRKAEAPAAAETAPADAQPEAPATAAAQPEASSSDTAAAKTETSSAPVETGSVNATHKAHTKHPAETPANASGDAAGYPSPVPPQESEPAE